MLMRAMRATSAVATVDKPSNTVALITAGDPNRLTGGYLYSRRVLEAMQYAGLNAVQLVLSSDSPSQVRGHIQSILTNHHPALVLVDSIAIMEVAPLATWIRQYLGAGIVALMHMLPSNLAPLWQKRQVRSLETGLLSAADHVIAVSPSLRHELLLAGASPERTTVVMPGKDNVPPPQHLLKPANGQRFLCVANWSPAKGIHTLVEAMAGLSSPPELDLVGQQADEAYSQYIFDLVGKHGLGNRVHIYGSLRGDELAQCYAAADVFVLPSVSEGFGTVYAEAMNFGLPIIACRIPPLEWLVEQDCGILVPPEDSGGIKQSIEHLATNVAARQRMARAVRRRAQRLPTWQESAEEFCLVIEKILRDRNRGVS